MFTLSGRTGKTASGAVRNISNKDLAVLFARALKALSLKPEQVCVFFLSSFSETFVTFFERLFLVCWLVADVGWVAWGARERSVLTVCVVFFFLLKQHSPCCHCCCVLLKFSPK